MDGGVLSTNRGAVYESAPSLQQRVPGLWWFVSPVLYAIHMFETSPGNESQPRRDDDAAALPGDAGAGTDGDAGARADDMLTAALLPGGRSAPSRVADLGAPLPSDAVNPHAVRSDGDGGTWASLLEQDPSAPLVAELVESYPASLGDQVKVA